MARGKPRSARRRGRRWLLLVGGAFALPLAWAAWRLPWSAPACPPDAAVVVVDTARHALALCESGEAVGFRSVRLGWSGTGKTREGDRRTPLGRYRLGAPRPSEAFGVFVPIGYPTEDQRRRGFTGSAIGIHGTVSWARWLGAAANLVDSTDGCVGTSDTSIRAIEHWLREHPAAELVVR